MISNFHKDVLISRFTLEPQLYLQHYCKASNLNWADGFLEATDEVVLVLQEVLDDV